MLLKYFYLDTMISSVKNPILIDFGNKVKLYRGILKISQEELASKAGLHRTYIGMIERAEKNITLINIQKIAKALDKDLGDFFYEHNASESSTGIQEIN